MTRREMLIESAALGLSVNKLSAWRAEGSPLRVCLLVEPNLPREGAPTNLSDLLKTTLGAIVVAHDADTIASQGIDADVFCNSHGSIYPASIGGKIYEHMARGGSLLHIGGIPFGRAITRKNGEWATDD